MLTNSSDRKKVRLYLIWSLAFSFLLAGCSDREEDKTVITVIWENQKAESIIIPKNALRDVREKNVQVRLANSTTAIIGELTPMDGALKFRPVIPFTRGLNYEVFDGNKIVGGFEIPKDNEDDQPVVLSIYPSGSKLPENLLKLYITFSKPMQEGQALNNIRVIRDHKDTVPVFLDLDQELWNKDRTMLTLWIDPGRTKRDLQPNIELGTPLHKDSYYEVLVKRTWRDGTGKELSGDYSKEFVAVSRDSLSPDVRHWTIKPPKPDTKDPLTIELHETLDYLLLKNTFRITDANGNVVDGSFSPRDWETILVFNPSSGWKAGNYQIEIESRLEDLAGNNLNRLFDNDLTKKPKGVPKNIHTRSFRVE